MLQLTDQLPELIYYCLNVTPASVVRLSLYNSIQFNSIQISFTDLSVHVGRTCGTVVLG